MKLLFDQNLSYQLVDKLSAEFPGSQHVRDVGLSTADDEEVWKYARKKDMTIVSKDSDFHQLSLLWGFPPKIVWIRRGNVSTREIEILLHEKRERIASFQANEEESYLILE